MALTNNNGTDADSVVKDLAEGSRARNLQGVEDGEYGMREAMLALAIADAGGTGGGGGGTGGTATDVSDIEDALGSTTSPTTNNDVIGLLRRISGYVSNNAEISERIVEDANGTQFVVRVTLDEETGTTTTANFNLDGTAFTGTPTTPLRAIGSGALNTKFGETNATAIDSDENGTVLARLKGLHESVDRYYQTGTVNVGLNAGYVQVPEPTDKQKATYLVLTLLTDSQVRVTNTSGGFSTTQLQVFDQKNRVWTENIVNENVPHIVPLYSENQEVWLDTYSESGAQTQLRYEYSSGDIADSLAPDIDNQSVINSINNTNNLIGSSTEAAQNSVSNASLLARLRGMHVDLAALLQETQDANEEETKTFSRTSGNASGQSASNALAANSDRLEIAIQNKSDTNNLYVASNQAASVNASYTIPPLSTYIITGYKATRLLSVIADENETTPYYIESVSISNTTTGGPGGLPGGSPGG